MAYVLEWRDAALAPARPGQSVVSHVRLFRSAPAIKAFLCRRAFARAPRLEYRLSLRQHGTVRASVITGRAAILGWDERHCLLPPALAHARWAAEIDRLTLQAELRGRIATSLARAEDAGVLSHADTQRIAGLLDRLLDRER
jgi:hypothetical protein